MSFLNILLLVFTIIVLIFSGVLTVRSAIDVHKIKDYDKDVNLRTAHGKLTISSVVIWLGVGLIAAIIALYLFFGVETAGFTGNFFITGMLILVLGILLTAGVLDALAAVRISDSDNFKQDPNKQAHTFATWGSVTSIVGVALVLFVIIASFLIGRRKTSTTSQTGVALSRLPLSV